MKILPYNYARSPGSNFEPQPSKDQVYIGYGENSLGILLTPSNDRNKINVGTVLSAISIVADTSQALPSAVNDLFNDNDNGSSNDKMIYSPDGYPFKIISYKEFEKNKAVKEFNSVTLESVDLIDSEDETVVNKRKFNLEEMAIGLIGSKDEMFIYLLW